MLNQLNETGLMTHMPFLTPDENGKPVLLFCQADASRIWKLYAQLPDGSILRLATGLPEDVCERSPAAWRDETGWHVSFIAGGGEPDPLYRLYRMDGPALHQLGQPVSVQATRAGFVYRDRLVHAEMDNLVHVRDSAGDYDIELPGAFIYRVAYRADRPDTLLISGQWQTEDDVFTLEYDLRTGQQNMIECDGYPAYKCTILGDQMLYAQRIGEQFEHRRQVRQPTHRRQRRPPPSGSGPAPRHPAHGQLRLPWALRAGCSPGDAGLLPRMRGKASRCCLRPADRNPRRLRPPAPRYRPPPRSRG
jgi:hypothetical protein